MLNRAGRLDIRHDERLIRIDHDRGRDFPALPELAGGSLAGALGGHAALALLAGEVLRADGARLGVRQPGQIAQAHVQATEFPALRERRACREADQAADDCQQRAEVRRMVMSM